MCSVSINRRILRFSSTVLFTEIVIDTRVDGCELLRVMREEDNESAQRMVASQLPRYGSSDAHQPTVAVQYASTFSLRYVTQLTGS